MPALGVSPVSAPPGTPKTPATFPEEASGALMIKMPLVFPPAKQDRDSEAKLS